MERFTLVGKCQQEQHFITCLLQRKRRGKKNQHVFIALGSFMYSCRDGVKRKSMRKSKEERELNRQKHFIQTPASATNV